MEPRSGTILASYPLSWHSQGFPHSWSMAARKQHLPSHGDSRESLLMSAEGGEQSPAHRHLHHLLTATDPGWLLWWGQGWSQRSQLALINH